MQPGEIATRAKLSRADEPRNRFRRDVGNIAFAAIDAGFLFRIDFQPGYVEPGFGENDRQRKSDVTQTNDRHLRPVFGDLFFQPLKLRNGLR